MSTFNSVVIYCKPFRVAFALAPLKLGRFGSIALDIEITSAI
jgi:hypothetical protein